MGSPPEKGDEHPSYTPDGVRHLYLYRNKKRIGVGIPQEAATVRTNLECASLLLIQLGPGQCHITDDRRGCNPAVMRFLDNGM